MRGYPNPALPGGGDDTKVFQSPHNEMAVGGGVADADDTGASCGSALAQDLITLGSGPLGDAVSQR